MDHDHITRFVRHTLGCGCPDEVFETIEVSEQLPHGIAARIVIGRKLLVYLVPETHAPSQNRLVELAAIGQADRDRHNYNRLRVVIIGAWADTESQVPTIWDAIVAGDDKAHIHCLGECPLLVDD